MREKSVKGKFNEKGITLIALIITIIIMLILVAVTIDIAVDGKLFDKAQEAVDRTNEKVGATQDRIDELMGELDSIPEGTDTKKEVHSWTRTGDVIECSHCDTTLRIGTQLNYTKTGANSATISGAESGVSQAISDGKLSADEKIQSDGSQTIAKDSETTWVVLGIEDSNGDDNFETLLITTGKPTEDYFYMYGAAAYNNAVTTESGTGIIDRVCQELYGSEARGITIEDVNNCLQYEPEGGMFFLGGMSSMVWYTTGDFSTTLNSGKTTELTTLWTNIQSAASTDDEGNKIYYTPEYPEGTTDANKLGKYEINGYYYYISGDGTYLVELFDEKDTSNIITEASKNLVFGNTNNYKYWMSSRGVYGQGSSSYFGPAGVLEGRAKSCIGSFSSDGFSTVHTRFYSTDYSGEFELSIRAVVPLTSEIPAAIE